MSGLARTTVHTDGDAVIVRIAGEIDLSNADELGREIEAAAAGRARVAVDLSGVGYLDSAGVRLVHVLAGRLRALGVALCVVAPPGSFVREVLDLAATGAIVDVVDAPGEPRAG